MNYTARRITSILLGLMSAAGTVVTAILVAKETPKALEKIKELKENNQTKKMDYVKALAPIYWPAGLMCLGTISSTTISQVLSIKSEASLIATTTMLSQGWRRYKGKVTDVLGIKGEQAISNAVSADKYSKEQPVKPKPEEMMFYEEHIGFFSCKREKLINALTDINQRLHTPDADPKGTFYWTSLYYLLKDAEATVYDKSRIQVAKNFGWTTEYLSEADELECVWVHPTLTNVIKKSTGEVLYINLGFFEEPICLTEVDKMKYHHLDAVLTGREKTPDDFKHEAEIDLAEQDEPFDYDAYMFATHGGVDMEDHGNRFYESSRSLSSGGNAFIEDDHNLPCESDIPELGGNN